MIIVNTLMGTSHHGYDENECTRYCHDEGCVHYKERVAENDINKNIEAIYYGNIKLLHNNGMGLSYAEANILIYVILIPLFSSLLLWGVIRKPKNE